MRIVNVYDASSEGRYEEFNMLYDGNVNQINVHTKLNLLQAVVAGDDNLEERMKIAKYLISNDVDINYVGGKYKRNCLHILFANRRISNVDYLFSMTKILIENNININFKDKFGAIPLHYLLGPNQYDIEDLREIYMYLVTNKSDYQEKDNYGNSCMDYATQFKREVFIEVVKEYKNGDK